MRFYKSGSSSFAPKPCQIVENSEKCVACVNNGRFCNLVSLNTVRWQKLKKKHVNG